MTERPVPPPPPPPPAPPVPAAPSAPTPPAAGATSPVDVLMGVPADVAAQSELDQATARAEDAQQAIRDEQQRILTAPGNVPEVVPTIPQFDSIIGMIKAVCLADGIPEGEFARDFPIPVEARLRLIANAAEKLTGRRPPADVDLSNMAAKCRTVGALIDLFEEQHPDHPTQSGAGS